MVRTRFIFRGTVQGVGFRPAVYRLALSLDLVGFVQNRRSTVLAEVQGTREAVDRFALLLPRSIPPAARLKSVETSAAEPTEASGFLIVESGGDRFSFPPIPPDLPLCAECTLELLDPGDRRFLYPFITCTQCGPRYSITVRTPFDRSNTTMDPFPQCPDCRAEYEDPADRRFHSQTNSCPRCGPRLTAVDARGRPAGGDPVEAAIRVLRDGGVVALQGIGGFHLAADPRLPGPVLRLRRDKDRERKPFALMVRDVEEARRLCVLTDAEERALCSAEAPIVISPRREDSPGWLHGVSATGTLGVMLPYTPLHLLLFAHPAARAEYGHLVMTSGNRSGEPIITDPDRALSDLDGIADLFLVHDRRIAFRTDDSVLRVGGGAFLLRRSRGYVPRLISLQREVRGVVLALGGDLKSAPALARGQDLHLCAYNGDLEDRETYRQFEGQIRQVLDLYGVAPDVVVHDLHPLYRSTRWAEKSGIPTRAVQHHFSHALSVMAEHGLEESLALSFDGTGYGTDGAIWGGEFLHATRTGFTRLGSFSPFPLPGGDEAVLHPPRTALALLAGTSALSVPGLESGEEELLRGMLGRGVNCPTCTSLGRVFDAAAAVLGLVERSSYEGEGPIRLEGLALLARGRWHEPNEEELEELLPLAPGTVDGRLFLADPRPLLAAMLEQSGKGREHELALLFHTCVARASVEGCARMRAATGVARVVLSGGVFQNALLRDLLVAPLINDGFEVFLNRAAPAGDGGLSLGQAWFEES